MANLINSLVFDGGTYVLTTPYATCSAAAGNATLTATVTPGNNFSLEIGARVAVKFTNAGVANATLNVNSTGAKSIYFRGSAITSAHSWAAGSTVDFVYDGTYWQMLGAQNNSTTNLYATTSSGTANAATTNGNTYLRLFDDSTARSSINIKGTGATTVTTDANGVITINSTDTIDGDTKVISVENHYTPVENSESALSVDASSTTSATWGTTSLVTGVNLQRDAAGHVTGLTVDSIKLPGNPETYNVKQNTAINTNGNYPVLLGASTTTGVITGTVNKSSKLLFNPSTGALTVTTLAGTWATNIQNRITAVETQLKWGSF